MRGLDATGIWPMRAEWTRVMWSATGWRRLRERRTAAGWNVVKSCQSPHSPVGVPCRVNAEVSDQGLGCVNLVTVEIA